MRDLLVLPKLGMKLGDLPIIIKEARYRGNWYNVCIFFYSDIKFW